MRQCSKPRCSGSAAAVLAYDYSSRLVHLEDAGEETSPHHYGLCARCADSLTLPRGWVLRDGRTRNRFLDSLTFAVERPDLPGSFLSPLERGGLGRTAEQRPEGAPEAIQKGHWSDPASWS